MSSQRLRLPKGVSALPRPRDGRPFRASIRHGKGVEIHLGLYETPWLAAFAYDVAARLLRPQSHPLIIPRADQPDADRVREITARVHRRVGLDPETSPSREIPPSTEDLLTLFEITAVGYWRSQAAEDSADHPDAALDSAADRLHQAASLLFWSRAAGHPAPLDALTQLLASRLDRTFRNAQLTRALLDDDGDDPHRVARWLVLPDTSPSSRRRPFRVEIRYLYADLFKSEFFHPGSAAPPPWAAVLGVSAPFHLEQIRLAYRARSLQAHPDAGGDEAAFIRLRAAYEAALLHFQSQF